MLYPNHSGWFYFILSCFETISEDIKKVEVKLGFSRSSKKDLLKNEIIDLKDFKTSRKIAIAFGPGLLLDEEFKEEGNLTVICEVSLSYLR